MGLGSTDWLGQEWKKRQEKQTFSRTEFSVFLANSQTYPCLFLSGGKGQRGHVPPKGQGRGARTGDKRLNTAFWIRRVLNMEATLTGFIKALWLSPCSTTVKNELREEEKAAEIRIRFDNDRQWEQTRANQHEMLALPCRGEGMPKANVDNGNDDGNDYGNDYDDDDLEANISAVISSRSEKCQFSEQTVAAVKPLLKSVEMTPKSRRENCRGISGGGGVRTRR